MSETRDVVINVRYGGAFFSSEVFDEWLPREPLYLHHVYCDGIAMVYFKDGTQKKIYAHAVDDYRENENLHAALREGVFFGRQDLRVISIPADVDYLVEEYDGIEWIAEQHRTWGISTWKSS